MKKKNIINISVIFIINILIFYRATEAFFVADDFFYIFNRNNLEHYSPLTDFFFQPLTLFVYYINYFWAGLNPYNYHIFTITLNAVITILIYFMILFLTKKELYALIGTIIMSVHYVPADNMIWINCTNNVICGFFYFVSILYSIKYNKTYSKKNFILMFIFLNLAFYTREMGVSLFLILILIDIFFYRYKSIKFLVKKHIYTVLFFLLYLIVMLIGPTIRAGQLSFSRGNYSMFFNPYWILVNINWFYFKLFIPFSFGSHIRIDWLHQIILFIRFNYIILVLIVVLAFIIKNKYYYFGVLWILLTSSPYLLLTREMVFNGERYFYLPRVGFAFIIISFWIFLRKYLNSEYLNSKFLNGKFLNISVKIVLILVVVFYSLLSVMAINKRIDWWILAGNSSESFFNAFKEHFPDKIEENTIFFIKDVPRWSPAPNKLIVLINGAPYGLKLFHERRNIEVVPYWADDLNETNRRLKGLKNENYEHKHFFEYKEKRLKEWTPPEWYKEKAKNILSM